MKKVSIDGLASAIVKELSEYNQDVTDGIKKDVRKVARECKEEVKDNSPVGDTGDYKKGWAVKTAFESKEDIRVTVHNKTDWQLTHLLENGHAKVNGGRVKAIPHIGPAEQKANKKIVDKAKVRVSYGK